MKLRPYQDKTFHLISQAVLEGHNNIVVVAPTGAGKCLAKGTPVMMHNGSIIPVENVQVGDLLMGPDSKPRTVTSLARGQEMMYKITPTKGDPYIVNESHILSLRITPDGKDKRSDQIVNISVRDYLKQNTTFKHRAKGWRVGVDFDNPVIYPVITPYMLGLWLGDGDSKGFTITTMDTEVVESVRNFAGSLKLQVRDEIVNNRCPRYHVTSGVGRNSNPVRTALRDLGLLNNKHIPFIYKTASREQRLELLAGMLDSDGHLSNSGYDWISISERMANDICFIARSLGLAAYKKPCQKTCYNNGVTGNYFRVSISGDTDMIPCRIPRNQAKPRLQKKNVLRTGIKVDPVGVDDYYGFEITGDRLFLLGDFTVTHNTVIFSHLAKQGFLASKRTLIDVNRIELLDQAKRKCEAIGLIPTMISAKTGTRDGYVYIAMVETLARRMAKGFTPKVDVLVLDEAHIKVHDKIIERLREVNPKMLVLGFTATPMRGANKPMPPFYTKLVEIASTAEMVDWGYLVKDKTFGPKEDFSDVKIGKDGDYDADDLYRKMRESNIFGGIVDNYKKNANGLKAICFSPNVAASVDMAKAFNDAGISARHLDGNMDSAKRDRIIKDFSLGQFQVLCNVNIATTGFDEPSVQCVIVNRATKILSLWLQMVGRGSRPNIDLPHETAEERKSAIAASSKPHFVVLDHGSNWTRHSLWSSEREWSLEAKKKKDAGGVAAIKECISCGALLKASARVCEFCGNELPVIEKVAKEASDFVEVELPQMPEHIQFKKLGEMTVSELEDRRVYGTGVKEYGQGWLLVQLQLQAQDRAFEEASNGKFVSANSIYRQLLEEYAKLKNYQQGWVMRQSSKNIEPKTPRVVTDHSNSLNLFDQFL